jgi:uncharacterized protein YlzI (FlbEa/FlbD family)
VFDTVTLLQNIGNRIFGHLKPLGELRDSHVFRLMQKQNLLNAYRIKPAWSAPNVVIRLSDGWYRVKPHESRDSCKPKFGKVSMQCQRNVMCQRASSRTQHFL